LKQIGFEMVLEWMGGLGWRNGASERVAGWFCNMEGV